MNNLFEGMDFAHAGFLQIFKKTFCLKKFL